MAKKITAPKRAKKIAAPKATAYYYLTVSYNIPDLELNEGDDLAGPYESVDEREKALKEDLGSRDMETSETVNVTLLDLVDGVLTSSSFIASEEDYPPIDDEDDGGTDEDDEDFDEDDFDEEEGGEEETL